MLSAIFLIPIKDNRTRKLHRQATFKEFENGLLIRFGGWTFHGFVYGSWIDKNERIIYDISRKYEVGCLKTKDLYTLECYIKQSKAIFGQEAIYTTICGANKLL